MSADFFERQDAARRRTGLLVVYFALAVLLIAAAVDGALYLLLANHLRPERLSPVLGRTDMRSFHLWTIGATLALIALGSLWKTLELGAGGARVAAGLGARPLDPGAKDPDERRLWNVVEEMALAAGLAVPDVYVLPGETGINAFAAGLSPQQAVIAVTEGALRRLSRDELQGVVAHEFSHILNGDMRLNLRLIGLLHGILMIALIGRVLMRASSRRSSRKNSGGAALLGLALFAIGYVGVFFGRLIKSAVSREREYLGDASAVQLTRNPGGLAGALVKIRDGVGSRVSSPKAEEASHLFFAEGLASYFATHPPIEDRIHALDPQRLLEAAPSTPPPAAPASDAPVAAFAAASPSQMVGPPPPESMAAANRLLASLPAALVESLRRPDGAASLVHALLLDPNPQTRAAQRNLWTDDQWTQIDAAAALIRAVGAEARFPVAELAAPALRRLPEPERRALLDWVHALSLADNHISVFECLLGLFLERVLLPDPAPARPDPVPAAATVVLSYLTRAGHPGDEAAAEQAFTQGWAAGRFPTRARLLPSLETGPTEFTQAVHAFRATPFTARRDLLEACAACVLADGQVRIEEKESLRVLAAVWDCPWPMAAGIK